ncbi:MAG TPA: hypothetical protein ENN60_00935 [archaeon]|nr:hypothetical protein [archaeon]
MSKHNLSYKNYLNPGSMFINWGIKGAMGAIIETPPEDFPDNARTIAQELVKGLTWNWKAYQEVYQEKGNPKELKPLMTYLEQFCKSGPTDQKTTGRGGWLKGIYHRMKGK